MNPSSPHAAPCDHYTVPAANSDFAGRSHRQLVRIGYVANGFGATLVTISILRLAPSISTTQLQSVATRTVPAFVAYLLVALPLGHFIHRRAFAPIEQWLIADRPPTDADRLAILGYPRRWAIDAFWIWAGGAVFFAALNLAENALAALGGGAVIVLGALTACSLQYVQVEKVLRPLAALTLAGALPSLAELPRRAQSAGARLPADDGHSTRRDCLAGDLGAHQQRRERSSGNRRAAFGGDRAVGRLGLDSDGRGHRRDTVEEAS